MINSNLALVVSIAKRYPTDGHDAARPDPGGHLRADPGGREVRLAPRLQVLHLRDLLDPPGDPARHGEQGAHDPHPDQRAAARAQGRARREGAGRRARPQADRRGDRGARRARRCADIETLRDMARTVTSLDRPVGEGGEAAFGDLLPSDAPAPEEEVVVSLREAAVRHALASLPERERTVVELRYGLDGDDRRRSASRRSAGASGCGRTRCGRSSAARSSTSRRCARSRRSRTSRRNAAAGRQRITAPGPTWVRAPPPGQRPPLFSNIPGRVWMPGRRHTPDHRGLTADPRTGALPRLGPHREDPGRVGGPPDDRPLAARASLRTSDRRIALQLAVQAGRDLGKAVPVCPQSLPRSILRVAPEHQAVEDQHGYRNREVVQRREGLRLHHPRRRRQGPLRAPLGDQQRRLPLRCAEGAKVSYEAESGPKGPNAVNVQPV